MNDDDRGLILKNFKGWLTESDFIQRWMLWVLLVSFITGIGVFDLASPTRYKITPFMIDDIELGPQSGVYLSKMTWWFFEQFEHEIRYNPVKIVREDGFVYSEGNRWELYVDGKWVDAIAFDPDLNNRCLSWEGYEPPDDDYDDWY